MLNQQAMGGLSPGGEQGEDLVGCCPGWRAEGGGGKKRYHVSKLLEEDEGEAELCPLCSPVCRVLSEYCKSPSAVGLCPLGCAHEGMTLPL